MLSTVWRSSRDSGSQLSVGLLITLMAVAGCSRAFYRQQADDDAYCLVGRANQQTRTPLQSFDIRPDPRSRMYEPGCPDCPPMPPDDPTAHRLMQCVDGMRGWPHWNRYGKTPFVQNPNWKAFLPYTEEGVVVLDRRRALHLARLNSRDYQHELEDLYLSALQVSFQRFQFDTQFYGGNDTFFTADGPDRAGGRQSLLSTDTDLQMRKLFAGGGELVVGMANSLVWQFAGPDDYSGTTLLDFSLVQPLLRAGGRAVVLENLTQAERDLLANVRQMQRFERSFFANVITGRGLAAGPAVGGIRLSALNGSSTGAAGGLLGLLEDQVRIRNQRQNVNGLAESLDRLEALYENGRIDRFQVDQARQALYSAQSRLLSLVTAYEDRLDSYKITMGLSPDIDVRIDDPMLHRFDLIDPEFKATQDVVATLVAELRDPEQQPAEFDLRGELTGALKQAAKALVMVLDDMQTLNEALPRRRANLERLSHRPEIKRDDVDSTSVDVARLEERVAAVRSEFARLSQRMESLLGELQAVVDSPSELNEDQVLAQTTRLSSELAELALIQAASRLESVTLVPIDLQPEQALQVARRYRRDWKNARADLVNRWREIEVAANDLRSDLDVVFSGDLGTTDGHPLRFRGTTGRLRVGLEFDAPLTRLAERNLYREVLIDYQRARREYYAYEDGINQTLRSSLRSIRLAQLDFELRRAAVRVAISQVELTQIRLSEPPKPGETSKFGATTARDLVSALSGLLSAQNDFLSAWTDYEVQRVNLDLDLGTMQIDRSGYWIDPGPLNADTLNADTLNGGEADEQLEEAEQLPIPAGIPLRELIETAEPPAVVEPPDTAKREHPKQIRSARYKRQKRLRY